MLPVGTGLARGIEQASRVSLIASMAFFTGIQGGDLAGGAAIALFLFPVPVAAAILFLTLSCAWQRGWIPLGEEEPSPRLPKPRAAG